jgi:hypothetical protein
MPGSAFKENPVTRQDLIAALWHGQDPFANPPDTLRAPDLQGWRSDHPFLEQVVAEWRPRTLVEVGVWKGASVLHLARMMQRHGVEGTVIAVDTWLGAIDHWADPGLFAELRAENGYPSLYKTFLGNILHEGQAERVVPLPLDSTNAAALMHLRGIAVDVVHLDAGHEEASVAADLAAWWPVLRPGGMLIADDYDAEGGKFPGVMRAVNAFCASHDIEGPWALRGKCKFIKRG